MNLRIPTAWLRASRWAETLRPHVIGAMALRLAGYADGGYPLYYAVARDGRNADSIACSKCATDAHEWGDDTARIVNVGVNWEDPDLWCDCGERIESAYAEEEGVMS